MQAKHDIKFKGSLFAIKWIKNWSKMLELLILEFS